MRNTRQTLWKGVMQLALKLFNRARGNWCQCLGVVCLAVTRNNITQPPLLPSFYPSLGKLPRTSSSYHDASRVVSLLGLAPSVLFHVSWAGCQAVQLWPTVPYGHPRLFDLVSHKAYLHNDLLTYPLTNLPTCRVSSMPLNLSNMYFLKM